MNENFQQSVDIDKSSDFVSVDARNVPMSVVSGIINQIFNKSNILLSSLNDFSNKYNSDDRKILSNKKFLLTFNELISLIKEAIQTQVKIYETDANQIETLKNLTQDFINDLSYNIFSFDKIEINQLQQNNYIKNTSLKNRTINNNVYNSTPLSPKSLKNKVIEYNNSNIHKKNKRFIVNNIPINIDKSKGDLTDRKSYIRKNEENYNNKKKNIKINKKNNVNKKNIINKSVETRKNKTIIEREKLIEDNNNYISYNFNFNNNVNNTNNNTNKNKYSHIGIILNKLDKSIPKMNENRKNHIIKNNLCSKTDINISAENLNSDRGIIKSSSVVKMREDVILTENNNENKILFSNIKKKQKVCYENNLFNFKTILHKKFSDYIVKTPNNPRKIGQNRFQYINGNEQKQEESKNL